MLEPSSGARLNSLSLAVAMRGQATEKLPVQCTMKQCTTVMAHLTLVRTRSADQADQPMANNATVQATRTRGLWTAGAPSLSKPLCTVPAGMPNPEGPTPPTNTPHGSCRACCVSRLFPAMHTSSRCALPLKTVHCTLTIHSQTARPGSAKTACA